MRELPDHPRPLVAAITTLAAMALFMANPGARAADLEWQGGTTVTRGLTPSLAMTVILPNVIARTSDFQAGLVLIGASRWQGRTAPNEMLVQCQVVHHFRPVDFGIGLALAQNADSYNPGTLNFSLMLEHGLGNRLSIAFRHFSNAGTHGSNIGRNLLLAGWRF